MKPGLLYQKIYWGRNHMIVGRLDDGTGKAACGQVIDPGSKTSTSLGIAGLDYRGEWLTCQACRAALKRAAAQKKEKADV